jgi:hypothetical protein
MVRLFLAPPDVLLADDDCPAAAALPPAALSVLPQAAAKLSIEKLRRVSSIVRVRFIAGFLPPGL